MSFQPIYHDLKSIGSKRRLHPELRDAIVAMAHTLFDQQFESAILDKDALTIKAMAGKALSAMKVRETTNNNDGHWVELIQYTTYGQRGDAWCMDEDQTCTAVAETLTGILSAFPMTASCADARQRMPSELIIKTREAAKRGTSFIFYHPTSGMGHIGQLWDWMKQFTIAFLTEGNTTAGRVGDKIVREGGGAYDTTRELDADPNMVLKMMANAFSPKGDQMIVVKPSPVEDNAQTEPIHKYLMVGDSGASVSGLQTLLNAHGASLTVDGNFGPVTKAAVISFQKSFGLTPDGIVGPITLGALQGTMEKPAQGIILSWEKGHPERAAWTKFLYDFVEANKASFLKAIDLKLFHPKADSFSDEQKVHLFCEIIVWTAYFESGWNPAAYSVDVGVTNDHDTWSEGLMQMSVVDQQSYGFQMGLDFNALLEPANNLHLALLILQKQIQKTGRIVVATNVYWATLRDPATGRFSRVHEIAAKTSSIAY